MMWLQLGLSVYLLWPALTGSTMVFSDDLMVDQMAALLMLTTVGAVATAATHASTLYSGERLTHDPRLFFACTSIFLIAMMAVFACNNLGFMWIFIEASTLFAAPLVYLDRTKHAVEATWKYVIICGVGVAFALLGTVVIFASGQVQSYADGTLLITRLIAKAPQLDYSMVRLGFIFCVIGYGTKAGIFPLHNWMPDAYSEAPAPACAMFSGALINCALFAIYRISQIVIASTHGEGCLLLVTVIGGISAIAGSLFLINQHNLKRLWAYSSTENVGIMLVAIGIGAGPLFLLQAINHSITKVAVLLQSGNIMSIGGTKRLRRLHGLIAFAPGQAMLMAISTCAVMGVPPFGTFGSELSILVATSTAKHWFVALMLVVAFTLSFIAVAMHIGRIVCGMPRSDYHRLPLGTSGAMPVLLLVSSLALGFFFSPHLWELLK